MHSSIVTVPTVEHGILFITPTQRPRPISPQRRSPLCLHRHNSSASSATILSENSTPRPLSRSGTDLTCSCHRRGRRSGQLLLLQNNDNEDATLKGMTKLSEERWSTYYLSCLCDCRLERFVIRVQTAEWVQSPCPESRGDTSMRWPWHPQAGIPIKSPVSAPNCCALRPYFVCAQIESFL